MSSHLNIQYNGLPAVWDGSGHYLVLDAESFCIHKLTPLEIASQIKHDSLSIVGISKETPEERNWFNLSFNVTNRCNLACPYCYANANSDRYNDISIEAMKRIVIYYRQLGYKRLYISFTGGEPTLALEKIKELILFIEAENIPCSFHMVTNGICSMSALDYLMDKNFDFTVSSDGLPDIHNNQRPYFGGSPKKTSSSALEKTLLHLAKAGALFQVRCTLTQKSINTFPEAIRYWADLGVKFLHFEPVVWESSTSLDDDLAMPSSSSFNQMFDISVPVAQSNGVYLINSAFMNLMTPSSSFCTSISGQRLHFNPDGSITTCYKVQSFQDDPKEFIMGSFNDRNVEINNEKYKQLNRFGVQNDKVCRDCFAALVCSGGCPLSRIKQVNEHELEWCACKQHIIAESIKHIYHCSVEGETSILLGSVAYDALVERKNTGR